MTSTDDLIEEANKFAGIAEKVQDESYSEEDRRAALNELRTWYESWHLRAIGLIGSYNQPEEVEKFNGQYQGFFGGKIAGFLRDGMEINMLYDPDEPVPFLDKYTLPFDREFKQPLFNQLSVLAGLRPGEGPKSSSDTEVHFHGDIYGGTNTLAGGKHFTQQVRVDDVQTRDLESLLGFLRKAGVPPGDLENLTEAIEADEAAASEGSSQDRVGEWIGKITGKMFSAGVTGASSEATIQVIKAIGNYYGVDAGS